MSVLICAASLRGQTVTIQLWRDQVPDPQPIRGPERAFRTGAKQELVVTDVSRPSMTVFRPKPGTTVSPTAVLVFPGGGYQLLAIERGGQQPCEYFTSLGITCFLVRYRVPLRGRYPEQTAMLEDGQQAMRLVRSHALDYGIDPGRIGVLGGSAGANLAALLSVHWDDARVMATPAAKEVPLTDNQRPVTARPDFAILCWPAYLYTSADKWVLDPVYQPNLSAPPTFIIQAEDDREYASSAINYYAALMKTGVAAELHVYPTGGHGFGFHPVGLPQEHWTSLLTAWLSSNGWIAPI